MQPNIVSWFIHLYCTAVQGIQKVPEWLDIYIELEVVIRFDKDLLDKKSYFYPYSVMLK